MLNYSARLKLVGEDPVSVAEFFNCFIGIVIEQIFKKGLFGKYLAHYGVVETQGRGGLHLHCLLWIEGVPESEALRRALRDDMDFQQRVVQYREFVVCESLCEEILYAESDGLWRGVENLNPPEKMDVSSVEFDKLVSLLATQVNIHKSSHTSSCRKFGAKECRFNFPREIVAASFFNEQTGSILSHRNHKWLNPYNKILMFLLRCNHDIQLLTTSADALALIYYITDYATKRQLKSYELFNFIAAGIRKFRNDPQQSEDAVSLSRKALMKCINTIGSSQEISGPMCALQILYEKESYTNENFVNINWMSVLFWYERHMCTMNDRQHVELWDDDQVVFLQQGQLSNLRTDYIFRGSENEIHLMNLYTYASTVYKVRDNASLSGKNLTAPFVFQHPQYATHRQRIREKNESCVVLIGRRFPDFESEKEEFCAAILILLKPWSYSNSNVLKRDGESWYEAYTRFIEEIEEETGNPFYQKYSIPNVHKLVTNIQSLKRCRDAAEVSRAEFERQKVSAESEDILEEFVEYDIPLSDVEDGIVEEGDMLLFQIEQSNLSKDSQLVSEVFVLNAFERISWLLHPADFTIALTTSTLESGNVSNDNVELWIEAQKISKENLLTHSDADQNEGRTQLFRTLDISLDMIMFLNWVEYAELITEKRNLNSDQRRALILIARHESGESGDRSDCLRMYIGGAAGTGKSEIVKALKEYFLVRGCPQKLLLSASTGTAASKLSGNTIHSLCKLARNNKKSDDSSRRLSKKNIALRQQWAMVEYLVVDEVSMISADLLYEVHRVLQYAKECDNVPFGGVNIIAFGDFYQFPPVVGFPLYAKIQYGDREPTQFIADSAHGLELFNGFDKVVILRTNYRQRTDPRYQQLLQNHLDGCLKDDDIKLLKSRVISANVKPPGDTQIIVNRNSLRSTINNHFVDEISRFNCLAVTTVLAEDSCSNSLFDLDLPGVRENLWNMDDSKTDCLAGILKIFVGMRCMITANIDTSKGLSNGSLGVIHHIPQSENDETPRYVLVKLLSRDDILYPDLPPGVAPVFVRKGSFKLKLKNRQKSSVTISRCQFPLIPSYAITDYKSQGDSLKSAILDIRKPPTGTWMSYFAIYVLLSRIASLNGLFIMYDFDESVFQSRPPDDIKSFMSRLKELDMATQVEFEMFQSQNLMD
jgi:hypothetical protein